MKVRVLLVAAMLIASLVTASAQAADDRELVTMPPMMQEHMLSNMRDHLLVLNELLADVAAEKFDDAAKVAEERLGMSSFGLHGAAHMAPFMPKPMQEAGGALHHAASRFAIVARNVDVERSYEGMKELTKTLNEMTAACNACHASYRIR
ncbi:MAG: hypothetical protein WCF85_15055 [Rhodospirillaceae bacterium]